MDITSQARRGHRIAGPPSVSEGARKALSEIEPFGFLPFPEQEDVEGWDRMIDGVEIYFVETLPSWIAAAGGSEAQADWEAVDFGNGATGYLVQPHSEGSSDRILFDIHGGALIFGKGESCRMFTMWQSFRNNARTYGIDYRMPPHHRYPVALDDVVAGYRYLLERYDADRIVISSNSAGGNLAVALILRCREEGLPMPAGMILQTPEVDLTESGDSFSTMADIDIGLPPLVAVNRLYANGIDLADPRISPLFADFDGPFPPTLITVGTRDRFLSNGARLNMALRRAGHHVELILMDAMPHGGFGGVDEDRELWAEARRFAERAWRGELRRPA